MPPIKRRGPRGASNNTRLPIFSLNGGVGRQAPNKRTPSEAQDIDNATISLEKGLEKRAGFRLVKQSGFDNLSQIDFSNAASDVHLTALQNLPVGHKLFFYWYVINPDNTFLIAIDYNATGPVDKLFYIFKVNPDATWTDITPRPQWDGSDPAIPNTYDSNDPDSVVVNNYMMAYNTENPAATITYGQAKEHGVVNMDSRAYITYGQNLGYEPEDVLEIASVFSTLLILNKKVKAGFTSGKAGKTFNLDGTVTTTDDIAGRPVTYFSSVYVNPQYGPDNIFLGYKPVAPANISGISKPNIEVSDYEYSDSQYAYIGQSLITAQSLKLPPDNDDWFATNAQYTLVTSNPVVVNDKARQMLRLVHDPDHPHYETFVSGKRLPDGRGKIYYFKNSFVSIPAGYYRITTFSQSESAYQVTPDWGAGTTIISGKGTPYLQRLRAPDHCTLLDAKRMPQSLVFNAATTGTDRDWVLKKTTWTPRYSGKFEDNTGPSVFSIGNDASSAEITAMAVYKDRLYMSARDTVFSSRLGDYFNFFINDPSSGITVSDPIDVSASSSKYSEVDSLTPFKNFLFIVTKNNAQYKLQGTDSDSDVSPLTVSISPVTYYSVAPLIRPLLMSTQLYFLDSKRMYALFASEGSEITQAIETSFVCPDYLPTSYGATCVAQAQDTILFVDKDNKNVIYSYVNRTAGDKVLQSCFYRHILDTSTAVLSLTQIGSFLYAVTKRETKNNSGAYYFFLERHRLKLEDKSIPRMDRLLDYKLIEYNASTNPNNWNVKYTATVGETTFRFPFTVNITDLSKCCLVLGSNWGIDANYIPTIKSITNDASNNFCEVVVTGQISDVFSANYAGPIKGFAYGGKNVWFGIKYTMNVELSTLYARDDNNNIIDGVLNIRTGLFRCFDTGNFDIVVTRKGRSSLTSSFSGQQTDYTQYQDTLSLETTKTASEFIAKVFGYAHDLSIKIQSDYVTPVNITNMEFKGKFKQKYSTLDN